MSISVVCDECSGTFQVQEKRAGKKVYCKLCNAVVRVPKSADDSEDVVFESIADITPLPRTRSAPLRRTKQSRRTERVAWKWTMSPKAIAGLVVLSLMGILIVAAQLYPIVGTALLALLMIGMLLGMVIGFGLMLVGGIGLIISAFEEDTTCGLLYMFLPFYSLYYMISRWDETRYPKLVALGFLLAVGGPMLVAGIGQVIGNNAGGFGPARGQQGFAMQQPQQLVPRANPWPPAALPNNPGGQPPAEGHEAIAKMHAEQERRRAESQAAHPRPLRDDEVQRVSQPVGNATLNVGDKVLVKWGASWWNSQVVEIKPDGRVQIHYVGWSDSSDEAVIADRIRIPNP